MMMELLFSHIVASHSGVDVQGLHSSPGLLSFLVMVQQGGWVCSPNQSQAHFHYRVAVDTFFTDIATASLTKPKKNPRSLFHPLSFFIGQLKLSTERRVLVVRGEGKNFFFVFFY